MTDTTVETSATTEEKVTPRLKTRYREEIVPGLTCVAAPVRNDEGQPIAGISVSIPSYRFAGGEQTYVDMVRSAALRVSRNLGYIET